MRETRTMNAPAISRHHRPRIPTVREFIRALRVLHRAYRDFPLRDRMHVDIRFLTCPFLPVVNSMPAGARVLEIGAGHGVFGVLARSRASRVVAVDPDARKVRHLSG